MKSCWLCCDCAEDQTSLTLVSSGLQSHVVERKETVNCGCIIYTLPQGYCGPASCRARTGRAEAETRWRERERQRERQREREGERERERESLFFLFKLHERLLEINLISWEQLNQDCLQSPCSVSVDLQWLNRHQHTHKTRQQITHVLYKNICFSMLLLSHSVMSVTQQCIKSANISRHKQLVIPDHVGPWRPNPWACWIGTGGA